MSVNDSGATKGALQSFVAGTSDPNLSFYSALASLLRIGA